MEKFDLKPLYGGAVQLRLPSGMIDASDLREIPDHQEVFISPLGDDSCAIVEIVDYQEDIGDAEAAQFYFGDLASQNEASDGAGDSVIESVEALTAAQAPCLLSTPALASPPSSGIKAFLVRGKQRIAKFKESQAAKNDVFISMLVLRLPSVSSDVLISISCPTAISTSSSSVGGAAELAGLNTVTSLARTGAGSDERNALMLEPTLNGVPAEAAMKEIIASVQINDWGLFMSQD